MRSRENSPSASSRPSGAQRGHGKLIDQVRASANALPNDQRSKYEQAVLRGRAVAERAVSAALTALDPLPHAIQHRLTALDGDMSRLVEEAAYAQWHRVLFARFLIENDLLRNEDGVPLSLGDCAEIAHDDGNAGDAWEVAARYAATMLPDIVRPDRKSVV